MDVCMGQMKTEGGAGAAVGIEYQLSDNAGNAAVDSFAADGGRGGAAAVSSALF